MADVENVSMTAVAIGAILSRDVEALENCLDQCGNDDLWLPSSGVNLLEHAVEENFISAVDLLLSRVPLGSLYTSAVKQAFVSAMRNDFTNIIRLFLEGALVGRLEMTLLEIFIHAVHKKQEDIARQVIEKPEFDINCEELWDGDHPLSVVIFRHCLHLAEFLVNRGAVIDAPNNKGETALVTACACQFLDCCRLLVIHGANPNHHSLQGLSPLCACYTFSKDLAKCENIVYLLLRAGLNISRETWIQSLVVTKSAFFESLKTLGKQPQSLKMLCLVKIRLHMTRIQHGVSILSSLNKLPLPLFLKNYVALADEGIHLVV